MKANFHTHTYRCHHAKGTERDFVLAAIDAGLEVIGIADHSPYYFPGDYYSRHRMAPEEIPAYTGELLALREEFKNDIKLYIGYEVEYYPAYFEKTLALFDSAPYDYLLLGQHFIGNEIGERHTTTPSDDPAMLDRFTAQTIEGLKTGRFFYLAHPDVFHFTGDEAYYEEKAEELCLAAKEMDIPLEINMLGLREGRHYPNDRFWEVAGRVGNKAILGCDAHKTCELAVPEEVDNALRYADRFRLEVIEPTEPIKQRHF